MALFSYKFLRHDPRPIVQLTMESGEVPLNLLDWVDPKSGVELSATKMTRIFDQTYKHALDTLRHQEPDVRTMVEAQAYDLAAGKLFLAEIPGPNDQAATQTAMDSLREKFAEMGHRLEEAQRKASIHLDTDEVTGVSYLTVPGGSAGFAVINNVARTGARVQQFIPDPATGRFRVLLAEADSPLKTARAIASGARDIHVINHSEKELLGQKAEVSTAQPFTRTGNRIVEIHQTRGDIANIAPLLEGTLVGGNGARLVRGSTAEQKAMVKKLGPWFATAEEPGTDVLPKSRGEKIGQPNLRMVADVLESAPKLVVASDAVALTQRKLNEPVEISEASRLAAASFSLKKSALTPVQKEGIAFMLDRTGSLLADETGSGKTIMLGSAAQIKTPLGQKSLVVCPPGLIPQWIKELDTFIAPVGGKPVLPENAIPPWLERLSKTDRETIRPAWERVSQRFVFLPDSALQSGVEVARGEIQISADKKTPPASEGAFSALTSILKEPISTLIVDEAQGMRVGGNKFQMLNAIAKGKIRSATAKFENVILGTATPLHRDAPDLYPMLSLLKVKKISKMERDDFCRDYCQRKMVIKNGEIEFSPAAPPYGYGMLKEEKIPEITAALAGVMIARTKEHIAPDRVKPRTIEMPVPYSPSAELGVSIKGITQAGELVALTGADDALLQKESNPTSKRQLLANAKTDATVADVQKYLKEAAPGEKITVFTQFIETARMLSDKLTAAGVPNYELSSKARDGVGNETYSSKQALISGFIRSEEAKAMIMTIGTGGTGINGLHRVSNRAIMNDYSAVAGAQAQAEGRVWRIEDEPITLKTPPAVIKYQVANHPLDIRDLQELLDRRHDQEFIVKQGMMQALDSPETLAARQMAAAKFREKILGRAGLRAGASIIDLTYLTSKQLIESNEAQEKESMAQIARYDVAKEKRGLVVKRTEQEFPALEPVTDMWATVADMAPKKQRNTPVGRNEY